MVVPPAVPGDAGQAGLLRAPILCGTSQPSGHGRDVDQLTPAISEEDGTRSRRLSNEPLKSGDLAPAGPLASPSSPSNAAHVTTSLGGPPAARTPRRARLPTRRSEGTRPSDTERVGNAASAPRTRERTARRGRALSGVHEFRQVELMNAGSLRAQRFGVLAFLSSEGWNRGTPVAGTVRDCGCASSLLVEVPSGIARPGAL